MSGRVFRKSNRGAALRAGVLLFVLMALTPASAGAFSKAIWGQVYRNGVNQFPLYKKLGVGIYEAQLLWNQVALRRPSHATNPADSAYQWPTGIQRAINQAHRYHMRVLLLLWATPSWANGGRAWNWVPHSPQDFANFATAAARRYPQVHLWMIWGEPSRRPNFQPETAAPFGAALNAAQRVAPHNYARLLDAAYGALHAVSRHNEIIGGSTYTTGDIDTQQWISNLRLPNGKPPRMDIYAHNPFTFGPPAFTATPSPVGAVAFSDLPRLAGWIDRYLRRRMPIFLSEFTIPSKPDEEFNFYVDPPVAAQWVSTALRLSRHWKRIYGLGWIHVYDAPPITYGGLLTASGKPKPVFYAFARG